MTEKEKSVAKTFEKVLASMTPDEKDKAAGVYGRDGLQVGTANAAGCEPVKTHPALAGWQEEVRGNEQRGYLE